MSKRDKKKLLFVINLDSFFVSHRLPIAKAAIQQGYEVHIAAAITTEQALLRSHGIFVHPLTLDRQSTDILANLKLMLQLGALFKKIKPDIVHLVTIKPVLLGGIVARVTRIPSVVAAISGLGHVFTSRGFLASLRRYVVKTLYRISFKHPNLSIIVQNQDDLEWAKTIKKMSSDHSITLIKGSGVDLNLYTIKALPSGTPTIMMASRLLLDKGVYEFALAARALSKRIDARFVLVGDIDPGNPSSLKRSDVEQWVEEGILEWWGYRKDMHEVLAFSHVVVLPSYGEGLPKVLIEAAAVGRAVITTDVPGCRDVILPDVTGLLIPVRDVDCLAKSILDLVFDKERLKQFGLEARRFAEHTFDMDLIVNQHLRLYALSS